MSINIFSDIISSILKILSSGNKTSKQKKKKSHILCSAAHYVIIHLLLCNNTSTASVQKETLPWLGVLTYLCRKYLTGIFQNSEKAYYLWQS